MFEKVLNQQTQVNVKENLSTVEWKLIRPTIEEVKWAIDMLKNGKASGGNTIIAELLKKGEKNLIVQLKLLVEGI